MKEVKDLQTKLKTEVETNTKQVIPFEYKPFYFSKYI